MGRYSHEPVNATKSCKARGSNLRVHFKVNEIIIVRSDINLKLLIVFTKSIVLVVDTTLNYKEYLFFRRTRMKQHELSKTCPCVGHRNT